MEKLSSNNEEVNIFAVVDVFNELQIELQEVICLFVGNFSEAETRFNELKASNDEVCG